MVVTNRTRRLLRITWLCVGLQSVARYGCVFDSTVLMQNIQLHIYPSKSKLCGSGQPKTHSTLLNCFHVFFFFYFFERIQEYGRSRKHM
ncbi:hypothetical protein ASPSYDRAFT_822037 [Aspergillus sydowii CBS 593.65]|uniref:Secreted protein n=1 Tax=Aspergillus sydowii CBS 593.65 TaxID=1036612 RepID=A0A1L9TPI9_9EURO|nr:uncharacterized protein ASPSYDRAFT_822037 [Aspergillus sydowii CBS 593.65]OJJ61332.1 hypothetical protein ASPSYDRAFT_822037 [Aspergillus sydowii CBS 593.65]